MQILAAHTVSKQSGVILYFFYCQSGVIVYVRRQMIYCPQPWVDQNPSTKDPLPRKKTTYDPIWSGFGGDFDEFGQVGHVCNPTSPIEEGKRSVTGQIFQPILDSGIDPIFGPIFNLGLDSGF